MTAELVGLTTATVLTAPTIESAAYLRLSWERKGPDALISSLSGLNLTKSFAEVTKDVYESMASKLPLLPTTYPVQGKSVATMDARLKTTIPSYRVASLLADWESKFPLAILTRVELIAHRPTSSEAAAGTSGVVQTLDEKNERESFTSVLTSGFAKGRVVLIAGAIIVAGVYLFPYLKRK